MNDDRERIRHATSLLLLRADSTSEELRELTGVATTPRTDSFNDIVEPLGATFELPLPLLWQHRHEEPIGSVISATATAEGVRFIARVARVEEPGTLKDRLDHAWGCIRHGLVKTVSIGFRPLAWTPLESGGKRFTRWAWHELSLATVAANADARIEHARDLMSEAQRLDEIARAMPGADLVERMLSEARANYPRCDYSGMRVVRLSDPPGTKR
ncbi:HK97 family phage prohead protease [Paraburkholderia youngii]|uniref:HK97 family phage prohead protease n=1 Tax=Paraburkholderia youngii TaxID=2782701 RepID=UPI003D1E221E